MPKSIRNIVFYNDDITQEAIGACLFYNDGSVKTISHDEGVDIAYRMAEKMGITTQEEFLKLINKRGIYVMSGQDFAKHFKKFVENSKVEPQKAEPNVEPVKGTAPKKEEKSKKPGFFKRHWKKFAAGLTALAIALGAGGVALKLSRDSKSGNIVNNNISDTSDIDAQDLAYFNLLAKSTNEDQKDAMSRQGEQLDIFNRDFANQYLEEGSKVKAGLTWDEMIALSLAYNTYTKDQIKVMFNGSEIDAKTMSDAYRNANLQLMGAYVISNREHPVNSSKFVIDTRQRAFVEKYNDLFLQCKETTGNEQIAAINTFYAELYKDFPISDEVREIGLSHSDSRKEVEAYKAAVAPIVAASEIMFQNKGEIDHTLSDKATDYFNDIGLCNLVDEKFERVATITLNSEADDSLPLYSEFRSAKIDELIYEGNYPISDELRDISQLEEFQKWVNAYSTTATYPPAPSAPQNTTKTKETSDRDEAVDEAGEDAVEEAERKADEDLEEQNRIEREKAEKEAEERRKKMQQEEDEKRKEMQQEVEQDDQDLEDKIDDANNSTEPVNEDDFGDHNVDFDDEHSDEDGNLDDSVKDITTDGTGAVDGDEPLPDPNGDDYNYSSGTEPTTENIGDEGIYSYEETYRTNEEMVGAYIRSMEGQSQEETSSKSK